MKNLFFQFTIGQMIFIILCLAAGGFVDFYLGARFGPEMFWGIRIDHLKQQPLLPPDVSDSELEAMLKEESSLPMTFEKKLEEKLHPAKEIAVVKQEDEKKPAAVVKEEKKAEEKTEEKKSAVTEQEVKQTEKPARHTLQIGSFSSLKEAQLLQSKFKKHGYSVYINDEEIPGKGMWHRVRLGIYPSREVAEEAAKVLKKNHRISPVIIKAGS